VCFKRFVEDSERLIEEVSCTTQGNVNFLECLFPTPILAESLKTAMVFLHDRVFCIQHETIDRGHRRLPIV